MCSIISNKNCGQGQTHLSKRLGQCLQAPSFKSAIEFKRHITRKRNVEKAKNLSLRGLFQLHVLLSFSPSLSRGLLEIRDSEGFIALCTRGFVCMLLINSDISFLIYVTSFLFPLFSIISDF